MLQITNTMTGKKEAFKPLRQEVVKVYFCGPTPYNFAHIWNLKTYVFEDSVIKTLRFLWYKVQTTMNITDIDDKSIRDSQKYGEKLIDFTQKYTAYFMEDLQKLRVSLADNIVPISTLVDEMVEMINTLIQKGYAYLADDGSVYYKISQFKSYGALAHLDFSGMKPWARINNDEYEKENASDFVLWKWYKPEDGENFREKAFVFEWETKILKGRPWWHIECSACNLKYFGAQIDIHMWGIDNMFPHHENEIAQSEACTGKKFAWYWIHWGHLTVDGKKMAKSLNNFYTLRDLEKHFDQVDKTTLHRAIRLSFLNAKYRDSVDFSFEKLTQNINAIGRIDEALKKLQRGMEHGAFAEWKPSRAFREEMQDFIWEYIQKLEDDFNMPEVLGVFFTFLTYANASIDSKKINQSEALSLLDMYRSFDSVISLLHFEGAVEAIPEEVQKKFEARNQAKSNKDFVQSDALRDEILTLWYKIVDDRSGSFLEKV